jgi:hypothetical protein
MNELGVVVPYFDPGPLDNLDALMAFDRTVAAVHSVFVRPAFPFEDLGSDVTIPKDSSMLVIQIRPGIRVKRGLLVSGCPDISDVWVRHSSFVIEGQDFSTVMAAATVNQHPTSRRVNRTGDRSIN